MAQGILIWFILNHLRIRKQSIYLLTFLNSVHQLSVCVVRVFTVYRSIGWGFMFTLKRRRYIFNNCLILLILFNHIYYITGYKCITYLMPVCVALTNRVSSKRSRPLNFRVLFLSLRLEIPLIQVSLSSNPTLKVKLKRLQFINNNIFKGKASEKRKEAAAWWS